MENIIILVVLGLILGAAAGYIWKEKKRGAKCIGCPHSKTCSSCHCSSQSCK